MLNFRVYVSTPALRWGCRKKRRFAEVLAMQRMHAIVELANAGAPPVVPRADLVVLVLHDPTKLVPLRADGWLGITSDRGRAESWLFWSLEFPQHRRHLLLFLFQLLAEFRQRLWTRKVSTQRFGQQLVLHTAKLVPIVPSHNRLWWRQFAPFNLGLWLQVRGWSFALTIPHHRQR